jgi:replication initiation and membrane attachment protein DnaB
MSIEENMDKKLEEFNEFMLKQAAITFSMEGVSKDLKGFLQKKISHNKTNITQLALMVSSIAQSPSKELRDGAVKKGSIIHLMLDHVLKEIRFTDTVMNVVIQNVLNKEAMLSSEKATQQPGEASKGAI